MQLDIDTLKYVKLIFDMHSDASTMTNGYRSLCKLIDDNEDLTAKQANIRTQQCIKKRMLNESNLTGKLMLIQEKIELGEYEVELYDDNDTREKLSLLGYVCFDAYKKRDDMYMMISWKNEN